MWAKKAHETPYQPIKAGNDGIHLAYPSYTEVVNRRRIAVQAGLCTNVRPYFKNKVKRPGFVA
jgi:hypothetical protein